MQVVFLLAKCNRRKNAFVIWFVYAHETYGETLACSIVSQIYILPLPACGLLAVLPQIV